MSLQRINSVEIENFRSYSTKQVFKFTEGFNLVSGENGSGKTSLRLAIVLGLFSRVSGMGIESIIRGKENNAHVKIEFVAGNETYTIDKTFSKDSKNSRAVLTNSKNNEQTTMTEDAILKCRQLISGTEESSINIVKGQFSRLHDDKNKVGELTKMLGNNMGSLLFPEQGRLVELFETNTVLKTIGLNETALHTNNDLKKLISRVDIERQKRLTLKAFDFECDLGENKTKNLAVGQLLDSKFKAAQDLLIKVRYLDKIESELQSYYTNIEARRVDEESISEGVDLDQLATKLEESAEEHMTKREAAEKKTESTKINFKNIENLLEKRNLLTEEMSGICIEIEIAKSKLTGDGEKLNGNENQHKKNNKEIKLFTDQVSSLGNWIDYENEASYRQSLEKRIEVCRAEIIKIDENNKQIISIQKEIEKINSASPELWRTIDDLKSQINEEKGRLSPWKLDKFNPLDGFKLRIDGNKFVGKDGKIQSSLVMKDNNDKVVISISNPTQSRSINDLEAELKSIFGLLGVKGVGELNVRKEKHQTLSEDLKHLQSKDFRSKEEIEMDELEAAEKMKERKKKPKSAKPIGGLSEWGLEKGKLEAKNEVHVENREELNKEQGRIEKEIENLTNLIQSSETKNSELKDELNEHRKQFGDDATLTEQIVTSRKEYADSKLISEALTSSKNVEEKGARKQAKNIRESSNERNEIMQYIATIQAKIDLRIKESDYSKYAETKEKLEFAVGELNLEILNTKALLLLQRSLKSLETDKMESIYPMLQTIVNNAASNLYGRGAKIILNKDGFPESLVRNGRSEINFKWESYGTREQLNLLYRLALIRIIAEKEGRSLCFALDDPLVNSDKLRRDKILNHLTGLISSGEHQVLVFTCHAEDYSAGHVDNQIKL